MNNNKLSKDEVIYLITLILTTILIIVGLVLGILKA